MLKKEISPVVKITKTETSDGLNFSVSKDNLDEHIVNQFFWNRFSLACSNNSLVLENKHPYILKFKEEVEEAEILNLLKKTSEITFVEVFVNESEIKKDIPLTTWY